MWLARLRKCVRCSTIRKQVMWFWVVTLGVYKKKTLLEPQFITQANKQVNKFQITIIASKSPGVIDY